jgi:osmotically-inducible protein OsmY
MASRKQAQTGQQARAAEDRKDWYRRWISDIADDVAAHMEGEPERDARMDDLRQRFTHLHRRLSRMRGGQRGRAPRGELPTAPGTDDERIRAEVMRRLADDWYVDASAIEVSVDDGVVTLTGEVENRPEKRLAEDCADDVPGVHDVVNALRIREPRERSADPRGDPDLLSRRTAI